MTVTTTFRVHVDFPFSRYRAIYLEIDALLKREGIAFTHDGLDDLLRMTMVRREVGGWFADNAPDRDSKSLWRKAEWVGIHDLNEDFVRFAFPFDGSQKDLMLLFQLTFGGTGQLS